MAESLGTLTGQIDLDVSGAQRAMQSLSQTMQKRTQAIGERMTKLGSTLSLGLTAPLAGLATAAIKEFQSYDKNLRLIGEMTQASGEKMDEMREKALHLGKVTSFSAGESTAAMLELVKGGFDADKSLGAIDGTLSLAAASGIDLATSAEVVTDVLSIFQLGSEDLAATVDAMAGSVNSAAQNFSQLTYGLVKAGPQFAAAGYSVQDTTAALAALANQGVKGELAGTALARMMMELSNPRTDQAAEMLEHLGIQTFDAAGNFRSFRDILGDMEEALKPMTAEQRNLALATIFGGDAMKAVLPLLNEGVAGFDAMKAAVSEAGAAAGLADAQMSSLSGSFNYLGGTIGTVLISAFEPFAGHLDKMIRSVADFVAQFAEMAPGTQTWIVSLLGMAAAIGPVLIVFGKIAAVLGGMVALLNPVTLALVAIGGAVLLLSRRFKFFPRISRYLKKALEIGPVELLTRAFARLQKTLGFFKELDWAEAFSSGAGLHDLIWNLLDTPLDFSGDDPAHHLGADLWRWFEAAWRNWFGKGGMFARRLRNLGMGIHTAIWNLLDTPLDFSGDDPAHHLGADLWRWFEAAWRNWFGKGGMFARRLRDIGVGLHDLIWNLLDTPLDFSGDDPAHHLGTDLWRWVRAAWGDWFGRDGTFYRRLQRVGGGFQGIVRQLMARPLILTGDPAQHLWSAIWNTVQTGFGRWFGPKGTVRTGLGKTWDAFHRWIAQIFSLPVVSEETGGVSRFWSGAKDRITEKFTEWFGRDGTVPTFVRTTWDAFTASMRNLVSQGLGLTRTVDTDFTELFVARVMPGTAMAQLPASWQQIGHTLRAWAQNTFGADGTVRTFVSQTWEAFVAALRTLVRKGLGLAKSETPLSWSELGTGIQARFQAAFGTEGTVRTFISDTWADLQEAIKDVLGQALRVGEEDVGWDTLGEAVRNKFTALFGATGSVRTQLRDTWAALQIHVKSFLAASWSLGAADTVTWSDIGQVVQDWFTGFFGPAGTIRTAITQSWTGFRDRVKVLFGQKWSLGEADTLTWTDIGKFVSDWWTGIFAQDGVVRTQVRAAWTAFQTYAKTTLAAAWGLGAADTATWTDIGHVVGTWFQGLFDENSPVRKRIRGIWAAFRDTVTGWINEQWDLSHTQEFLLEPSPSRFAAAATEIQTEFETHFGQDSPLMHSLKAVWQESMDELGDYMATALLVDNITAEYEMQVVTQMQEATENMIAAVTPTITGEKGFWPRMTTIWFTGLGQFVARVQGGLLIVVAAIAAVLKGAFNILRDPGIAGAGIGQWRDSVLATMEGSVTGFAAGYTQQLDKELARIEDWTGFSWEGLGEQILEGLALSFATVAEGLLDSAGSLDTAWRDLWTDLTAHAAYALQDTRNAVQTAFLSMAENWDAWTADFRTKATEIWTGLTAFVAASWQTTRGHIAQWFKDLNEDWISLTKDPQETIEAWWTDLGHFIYGTWTQTWANVVSALRSAWSALQTVFEQIKTGIAGFIDPIVEKIGELRNALERLRAMARRGVPRIAEAQSSAAESQGASPYSAHQPPPDPQNWFERAVEGVREKFQRNQAGTDYFRGGMTWVGEQGPELLAPPRGSQIFSYPDSMSMLREQRDLLQDIARSMQDLEQSQINITAEYQAMPDEDPLDTLQYARSLLRA